MTHEITIWALLLRADLVVQATLAALVGCSIACWTVIVNQHRRLGAARLSADALAAELRAGSRAGASPPLGDLATAILAAGAEEQDRGRGDPLGSERAERAMRAALVRELQKLEAALPWLATIGSVSPFVGLFGTVWGIMDSFMGIARTHDTSLAVVAPGIAEALFMTAMGLLAAVPAVVAYNKFGADLRRLSQRLAADVALAAGRVRRPLVAAAE